MSINGLTTFSFHSDDTSTPATATALREELETIDAGQSFTFEPENTDPETVARRYLVQAIASPDLPEFEPPAPGDAGTEYRTIGTESIPLTDTTVVKFAQYRNTIPVYGSLISVELEKDNSLLSISSALGDPEDVDPVAQISPAEVLRTIGDDGGITAQEPAAVPRLYYYYDSRKESGAWRLVYITKNVPRSREDYDPDQATAAPAAPPLPELVDYVVDAHTGELVTRLPRTQSVVWTPAESDETDGLGRPRHIHFEQDGNGGKRLRDAASNAQTFDFGFRDVKAQPGLLPGAPVTNPPAPWSPDAISAHANAELVAEFLATVLQRRGLDGMGGPFISTINCTYRNPDPTNRIWRNAAWIGSQMIYGQRPVNGKLQSYAVSGDVVAHEITHGLTDRTARLEYREESGALNESYSDIFGVIISNFGRPVSEWNWEIGEDLSETGVPIRDLSDPKRRGQPDHMDDFKRLAPGEEPDQNLNDLGYVHRNSGIHNKAAFNVATASSSGQEIFNPTELAALFYLALTQRLSRTSGFRDSRRGVELSARTLFRGDPRAVRAAKLAAIADAFDKVGITK